MLNFLDMFWKFLDVFWAYFGNFGLILDLASRNEYFFIQHWIKVNNFLQFVTLFCVRSSFKNAVTVELFIPRSFGIYFKV